MPAAVDQCPQGHDTRTTSARDTQGHCRKCKADTARRRRVADSAALIVVRALEKAGAVFQSDGVPADPADVVRQLADAYAAGLFDS
uniref:TetR family transcriptional regulator n=1 Tax=Mycolicibacterium phage Alyssa1 TaxID=3240801 RepID=A0AB39U2G8_9CAUD